MPLADKSVIWNIDIKIKEKKRGSKPQIFPYKCFMYSYDDYGGFANICLSGTNEVKVVYLSKLYDDNGLDARTKLGYSLSSKTKIMSAKTVVKNEVNFGLEEVEEEW